MHRHSHSVAVLTARTAIEQADTRDLLEAELDRIIAATPGTRYQIDAATVLITTGAQDTRLTLPERLHELETTPVGMSSDEQDDDPEWDLRDWDA